MSQARGRGVVVLLANAGVRRPAWRACGENFPLVLSPHAKKNAACASRRFVVGCWLFVNHNKNQTEETPTRIGGGGNEGGTRAMAVNARAKEEEGELKEGGSVEGRRSPGVGARVGAGVGGARLAATATARASARSSAWASARASVRASERTTRSSERTSRSSAWAVIDADIPKLALSKII